MTVDGGTGGGTVARWRLAATTALAVMAMAAGCTTGHGQPTSGAPPAATSPPAPSRPSPRTYYAQVAAFTGPEAWKQARQARTLQAKLRAKGFPATLYQSHTEFPTHTLYFFVAVASGEFPTRDQAQAQVERLHDAGFASAEVFEISLPK